MKNTISIIVAAIALVTTLLVNLLILFNACSFPTMAILLCTMNGLAIVAIFVEKACQSQKKDKEDKQISPITRVEINKETPPSIEPTKNENEWANAMYARYADRWNALFENITYPVDKATKGEIISLCWEIASVTMDMLMVEGNDPNTLQRHKHSIDIIIKGKSWAEADLETFYDDPTTIPTKVLAVYNILKTNAGAKQVIHTPAFGYLIESKTIKK